MTSIDFDKSIFPFIILFISCVDQTIQIRQPNRPNYDFFHLARSRCVTFFINCTVTRFFTNHRDDLIDTLVWNEFRLSFPRYHIRFDGPPSPFIKSLRAPATDGMKGSETPGNPPHCQPGGRPRGAPGLVVRTAGGMGGGRNPRRNELVGLEERNRCSIHVEEIAPGRVKFQGKDGDVSSSVS